MRITNRGRYALRATMALACLGSRESPVSITALSQHEQISSVFLEQIFFKLRKAGIVDSVRGPKGGFYIAKPLNTLTFKNILDAANEVTELTFCNKNDKECPRKGYCSVHPILEKATDVMNAYLDTVTLESVTKNNSLILSEYLN